jgi:drug/metabolite transporter (DMT)-like permease
VLGVCLAALSAATFAFNNASARRGVLTGSVLQALAITVPIGVPIFLLAVLATGNLATLAGFSTGAVALLALAGVLHFVIGRYGNFRAAQAIGNNLSAPVIQLGLVVSLACAVVVLKEALTPLRILGIALLALGPVLMRNAELPEANAATPDAALPKFVPRYAEGYAFALVAAAIYGATPVLIRLGVVAGDLGSGLVGGLISYAAAALAVGLLLLWPGRLRHALAITPQSLKWFTYSGVSVCIAQMFVYMAFTVAPVSVVMPVLQLHLALRFWLARVLNPQHELFGGRMLLGTAVSLAGALAISLDSEFFLSVVALPPPIAAVVRWHWP